MAPFEARKLANAMLIEPGLQGDMQIAYGLRAAAYWSLIIDLAILL
jgi:hypothetical protein